MLVKRLLILLVVVVAVVGAAGCSPDEGGEASAALPVATDATAGNPTSLIEVSGAQDSRAQGGGQGQVVGATTMSDEELANQPAGESDPGAAEADSGVEPADPGETLPSGEMLVFRDEANGFSVAHPADFVVPPQDANKLAELNPTPLVNYRFMNRTLATSELADTEAADLEVRVYEMGTATTMEAWLRANNLLPADGSVALQPFETEHVSGGQLCGATMMGPGCAYYVMADGRVYQLIPASLEGESMVQTFELLP